MIRWPLLGLAVLTALVVPCLAGIRVDRAPNRLEVDGLSYGSEWTVSSPTLRSPSGYLAYDVSGKSPKVTFDPNQGRHATWTFVEAKIFRDKDDGLEQQG